MTTTNRSYVTGIFDNEQDAQQAMDALQKAGYSNKQILYSPHKKGASILDSLLDMGFGQEDATYYNSEFQQGRTIVTVNDEARQQEARTILQRLPRRWIIYAPASPRRTGVTHQRYPVHAS